MDSPEIRYKCSECYNIFPGITDLISHELVCKKPSSCTQCDKEFLNGSELKLHERIHELKKQERMLSEQNQLLKPKIFSCVSCDKSFSEYNTLRKHKKEKTRKEFLNAPTVTRSSMNLEPL